MSFDNFINIKHNYIMKSNIEKKGLILLIEVRRDSLGKECFLVSYADKTVRFRELLSVLDFVSMNKGNLGYVE